MNSVRGYQGGQSHLPFEKRLKCGRQVPRMPEGKAGSCISIYLNFDQSTDLGMNKPDCISLSSQLEVVQNIRQKEI